jgi:hypothetical protein
MLSAPSVSYPVGRSRDAARLLMVFWAAGAGVAGAWCYQINSIDQHVDWRQWAVLAAVVMATVAAWQALGAQAPGELRWDGQFWLLDGGEHGGGVASIHLDLQSLMLVRLAPAGGGTQWLWLERRAAPERWRDLRRALYARAVATRADAAAS